MAITITKIKDKQVKSSTSSGGIGFLGMLSILFIGLKLTGYINWSWWLVLLPIYGPVSIMVPLVLLIIGISMYIGE